MKIDIKMTKPRHMKNRLTKLITLLLVMSSITTFAQDYDLNSYDFRYQKFRGLTFDFDLGNSGSQDFTSSQDTFTRDSTFNNTGESFTSFNFNPSYFSFTNTDELQRTVNASFAGDFSFGVDKNVSTDGIVSNRDMTNDLYLSYSNTSCFYTGEKFKYLQVSTQSTFDNRGRIQKLKGETNEELKDWSFGNRTSVSYGFGTGRMNNVTDAVQAMFMLEDLKALNGANYSNEQIEGIAQGITLIRNARYLDFRIGYKTQLKMLDSVLRRNGVDGEQSIDYFTIISDNWLYANRAARVSGSSWTHFASLDNKYYETLENNRNNSGDYNYSGYKRLSPSFSLNTTFTRFWQKSLFVQKGFTFRAKSSLQYLRYRGYSGTLLEPIKRDEIELGTPSEQIESVTILSGTYSYLFQPNTRNTWMVNVMPVLVFAQTLPKYASTIAIRDRTTLQPRVSVNSDYYHWFSPHLNMRASGTIGVNSNFYTSEDESFYQKRQNSRLSYDLSFGINYQLF
jgi:hypothetical protein